MRAGYWLRPDPLREWKVSVLVNDRAIAVWTRWSSTEARSDEGELDPALVGHRITGAGIPAGTRVAYVNGDRLGLTKASTLSYLP